MEVQIGGTPCRISQLQETHWSRSDIKVTKATRKQGYYVNSALL